MSSPDIQTILATLSRAAESFRVKAQQAKKEGNWNEALVLNSKREGIQVSMTLIQRLMNKKVEIV